MIVALDARVLMSRHISGAEQHARHIVSEWAALGLPHEFLLLCDKSHQNDPQYDNSFIAALPTSFKQVFISGFKIGVGRRLGGRWLYSLNRALARNNADVYHSFTPEVPPTSQCPVVQTIHDLAFELDADVRRSPESRRLRRMARSGASWAARIIAVSSQTKNDIVGLYHVPPEYISVVYNGLNLALRRPDPTLHDHAQLNSRFTICRWQYVLAVGSDIPPPQLRPHV